MRLIRSSGSSRAKTPQVADVIFAPAKHFITEAPERERAIKEIQAELKERLKYFEGEKEIPGGRAPGAPDEV